MKVKVQGVMMEHYPNCHLDMTNAEWLEYRKMCYEEDEPEKDATDAE